MEKERLKDKNGERVHKLIIGNLEEFTN